MRRFEVIVVIRPVHVGGHGADKVAAVLATVGLAEFDAGDFGDGIPLIGRFQRAGKQIILLQWLGRQLRINAGAAQEEQFDNSGLAGAANQIVLDLKILIEEFCRLLIIGFDPANSCRSHEHIFRFF